MLRWTVHLEGGPRRVNHAAVAIGDKIYSFGGYCTGEDYETRLPIDVHVLDTISLRWRLLPIPDKRYSPLPASGNPTIPYQRYGHTAVAYGDSAYIWGGRNDTDGACNVLFVFNTVLRIWGNVETNGSAPGARDGHSACVISKKMYIFGGYEEAIHFLFEKEMAVPCDTMFDSLRKIERFSDDIYSFDFETRTWAYVRARGTPARWRDFHTAVGMGKYMYVFGGRSDQGGNMFTNVEFYCNKIQAFDTMSNTWFEPVTHVTYNNCIYIFGGYNGQHDLHFKDIFKFDTTTYKWSLVNVRGTGPCARRRQCCCKIGTKVYLFGGTSPTSQPSVDTEEEEVGLMDLSDLHVLDLEPSLKTLAKLAVLDYKLDTSCLPRDISWELAAMTTPNVITRPVNSNG